MGQELQLWQQHSTALAPMQKYSRAVEMVRYSTSRQQAIEHARKLVGCYPHAKPPDPNTYAGALADVLEQYPLGVVQECCDPRTGIVRSREFPPTVACIVKWCDLRVGGYRAVAERGAPKVKVEYSEEHCASMRKRLGEFFKQWGDELRAKYTTQQHQAAAE